MNRTEYEIAEDEHDMLNLLLRGDEILREYPLQTPRIKEYVDGVQRILERRSQRLQQRVDERKRREQLQQQSVAEGETA